MYVYVIIKKMKILITEIMVSLSHRIAFLILPIFLCIQLHAQTKIIQHDVVFKTDTLQSMWGPGNGFQLNRTTNFFERVGSDFSFDTRPGSILSVAKLKFGVGIWGRFAFGLGPLAFKISGFEGGGIGVKYPIKTTLTLPNDSTFNAGETITIKTDYAVQNDYELTTAYPATGEIALDMPVMFDMQVGIDVCLFDCFSVKIFPPDFAGSAIPSPLVDFNWVILKVNKDEFVYPCLNIPPVCNGSMPSGGGRASLPPSSPLSGSVKIPNVVTTASLSGKDLIATGSDPYLIPSLDIIQLLSFAPPPIGTFFAVLSSGFKIPPAGIRDLGGTRRFIELNWTLFTMNLNLPVSQSQKFTFHPTVNLKLKAPVVVGYSYQNSTTGSVLEGRDSIIDVPLGADLKIQYPCNMSQMDLRASYVISTNKFTNRTYDRVDVELVFAAFEFGIVFPDFDIIPRTCFNIGVEICFQLTLPGFSLNIGPLVQPPALKVAGFDLPDYVNRTWQLNGFSEQFIVDPFRLIPRKLQINVLATNATCFGSATGSATFDVIGVTAPLTYSWSNGITSKDLSAAPAGRQYVIATDVNNCRVHTDVLIMQPDPIHTSISATNLLCYNDLSGSASVSATGGTPAYTYQWSNGQASSAPSGLTAGKHVVTLSDINGCKQSDSILISQPPDIKASILNSINPTCFGKLDGSISTDASGGVQPYFYQWTNGQTDKDIRLLSGGNYSLSLTDANGCVKKLNTSLIEPPNLAINLSLLSDVACLGGKDGSVLANVYGGTPPYQYAWKNIDLELSNTSNLLTGLPAGIYALAVHDNNNCTADNYIEITAPQFLLESNLSKKDLSCFNGSDGNAKVVVTGGTSPYNINWSNGSSGDIANNLSAGVYTVTIQDSKNCSIINKAVIVSPSQLTINVAVKDISCAEQQDGELSAAVLNGVSPYNYLWSNGTPLSSVKNLAAGTYTITVTDKNNCVSTKDATINGGGGDCLFIPDAFSPNNDGVNDRWVLRNIRLYPNNSMQVFNQWGQQLYSATPYLDPWDGKHNGNLLPPATYYYIFSRGDGSASFTGPLTLLK
jgi:gliding motility-associated-like protein